MSIGICNNQTTAIIDKLHFICQRHNYRLLSISYNLVKIEYFIILYYNTQLCMI
jgi:hypothetical protein